ncbi:hypothetical protein Tco_0231431 [Tanacetum coccineum]
MKDVFEATESDLCETWKQNELVKDQLLEANLKHEIECCVFLSHECVDNNMKDEIEKFQRDSIEIQEGIQKRINILENDVQRCQKQSLDFELKLQHEKEKQKCESSLKNVYETSWISKMEKLESENVSLEFQVQYQKLFDSIKKTCAQTQGEINELFENVKQKTYAYADVRVQNQDLLLTIFELKAKLKTVENGKSVNTKFDKANTSPNKEQAEGTNENVIAPGIVRTPSNRDSSFKNSVVSNTKSSSKTLEVSDRTNKKPDVASKNVGLDTFVTNDKIKNALIAKNVLCVSCAKNVLIPCHGNCLAKYKLNVHLNVRRALFTTPRIVKSTFKDTTPVVSKTRISIRTVQSKSLDTTPVVSKAKIVTDTPLSAKNKWIVDSGCFKHMAGDRSLLKNYVKKFMGTVRFGNDLFAAITRYGDYVQGNITICHVYYVEGLGHNLFSVGQFCDGDLEVAFRSKTCYVRNLEGDDLLTRERESNYTLSLFPIWLLLHPFVLCPKLLRQSHGYGIADSRILISTLKMILWISYLLHL